MAEKTYLDPSLTVRPARWADISAVARLAHEVAELEGDSLSVRSAEELANEWKSEGFNVERDVFVVESRDGRLVGSEEFYNERGHHQLKADGCVHPDFRGMEIGSYLLEKITGRAKAENVLAAQGKRVYIRSLVNNRDKAGHSLLRNHGYAPQRYYWRMEIKLQESPPL